LRCFRSSLCIVAELCATWSSSPSHSPSGTSGCMQASALSHWCLCCLRLCLRMALSFGAIAKLTPYGAICQALFPMCGFPQSLFKLFVGSRVELFGPQALPTKTRGGVPPGEMRQTTVWLFVWLQQPTPRHLRKGCCLDGGFCQQPREPRGAMVPWGSSAVWLRPPLGHHPDKTRSSNGLVDLRVLIAATKHIARGSMY